MGCAWKHSATLKETLIILALFAFIESGFLLPAQISRPTTIKAENNASGLIGRAEKVDDFRPEKLATMENNDSLHLAICNEINCMKIQEMEGGNEK